jgi:hypothetical protein
MLRGGLMVGHLVSGLIDCMAMVLVLALSAGLIWVMGS